MGRVPSVTARRISDDERRARLARRHLLGPHVGSHGTAEVAEAVVALHATDPATVYLSIWARTTADPLDVDRALYEDRTVVRMLGMRRTVFVVPLHTAPLLDRSCGRPIAERERRRTVAMLEEAEAVDDPSTWVERVAEETLEALVRLGEATARELTSEVPDLATRVTVGRGKKWQGEIGMSTRILFQLAAEGRILRGRPRGTWVSSQYRWVPVEQWASIPDHPGSDDDVAADLVARYVARFGPVTEDDVVWWTGWTKAKTRRALAGAALEEVSLAGGEPALVATDDLDAVSSPGTWVAFLPALDPTIMGWKQRAWYLDDRGPALFDTNGNAGPTVWVDGRAVGAWGQRDDGEVVWRLVGDVGAEAEAAIVAEAAGLSARLDHRVVPRFPSPLHKELGADP